MMRKSVCAAIAAICAILTACGDDDPPPSQTAARTVTLAESPVGAANQTPVQASSGTDASRAAAPRQIDVQPTGAASAIVRWTDVSSDETGFLVERRLAGAANWTAVTTTPANKSIYKDPGLTGGAKYTFRVTALRSAGAAVSPNANVTMPSPGKPSIFFVDDRTGNDDNNDGSEARPWKTIQRAHDAMRPGQTVLVRAGLYKRPDFAVIVQITTSGRAGAYITYKAYPGERAKLKSTVGENYYGFEVLANYIIVDGFEIEGHLKDLTLAQAQAEQVAKQNGGPITPVVVSAGIAVGDLNGGTFIAHHNIVRNNLVYDHPQSGINAFGTDYVTVENNRVFNNSSLSYFGSSGINFFQLRNLDNAPGYHNFIRNNISARNSNLIPCLCSGFTQVTDGNGIIIDDFTATGYTGKILIANNLIYDNGGRGIHVFQSGNVDIFGNTTYRNSTIEETGQGEITTQNAANVRVFNNIMFASNGRPANRADQVVNVIFDYNVVFGGTGFNPSGGTRNLIGSNPRFAATSGPSAFALLAGSPAIDAAIGGGPAQSFDAYFAPRPRGNGADIGAVESF
jgi:hypothetical protein